MNIDSRADTLYDRIHFYVEDAQKWRDWFVDNLGFQVLESNFNHHTHTEVVKSGLICFAISSPLSSASPVAKYLSLHPPGVADIPFYVNDIESVMAKAIHHGVKILQPIQHKQQGNSSGKWCQIAAWGSLRHTLIESQNRRNNGEFPRCDYAIASTQSPVFTGIDHIVLNVNAGEMETAVAWYEKILEFRPQQKFNIYTDKSGLHSQVMLHPNKRVQFPINEPASANSQIQEFLNLNQGPGIQHIALQTPNLLQTISHLRSRTKLRFIDVPSAYYTQLQQRQQFSLSPAELQAIAEQQILVDWEENNNLSQPQLRPLLLQTFTQPIFSKPTFFFELIERRVCYINGEQCQAQGFGEGNFRALFEAIERQQIKRGSLEAGYLNNNQ